jgi:hypothetical protein
MIWAVKLRLTFFLKFVRHMNKPSYEGQMTQHILLRVMDAFRLY